MIAKLLRTVRWGLAGLALAAAPLHGQSTASSHNAGMPSLDVGVASVHSGGRWESPGRSGYFRVVEIEEGWEEVRHRVFVQWIEESPEHRTRSIRAVQEIGTRLGAWSVSGPQLVRRGAVWYAAVRVADAPIAQPSRTVMVRIGRPGELQLMPPV
jgi:hypothetical protein